MKTYNKLYEMESRINKESLMQTLVVWNSYAKRKIHLIACGGTAMTLLDIKESTKDIDLILPDEGEYNYLIRVLTDIGYEQSTGSGWAKDGGFIFDIFRGNKIFTTDLLESPLDKGNHYLLKEYSYLYVGILNYYDLIISKLFRSYPVDVADCLALYRARTNEINIEKFTARFLETASYDIGVEKHKVNLKYFLELLEVN